VALRSQGQLPSVGNLWVGERGARRQEALAGKANLARLPEMRRLSPLGIIGFRRTSDGCAGYATET
jgi:hypothetical protein